MALFGLVVRFDLKAEHIQDFDMLTDEILQLIHTEEPGTLLYACHTLEDDETARVFYELYADKQAFLDHEEQPHIKKFLAERQQYLASNPRVEFFATSRGKNLPYPSL